MQVVICSQNPSAVFSLHNSALRALKAMNDWTVVIYTERNVSRIQHFSLITTSSLIVLLGRTIGDDDVHGRQVGGRV